MNLTDSDQLKLYLKSSGLKLSQYMGQNFLVDEEVLAKIIQAADLKPTDVVVEVGPGLGVLTQELVQRAGQVIAIEKDKRLFEILEKRICEERQSTLEVLVSAATKQSNLKVDRHATADVESLVKKQSLANTKKTEFFNQDILRFNLSEQVSGSYKVVANIPYYLTSKLFQYFLAQKNQPKLLVLMVQKEVGERVVAGAGELSILGISVQLFADAQIAADVAKTSFWPVPKVDSVILKIIPKIKYPEITDEKLFFRIVKSAFAGKRKQIHNTLISGLKLPKEKILEILTQAGIDATARPQDISIEQWIELYKLFDKFFSED